MKNIAIAFFIIATCYSWSSQARPLVALGSNILGQPVIIVLDALEVAQVLSIDCELYLAYIHQSSLTMNRLPSLTLCLTRSWPRLDSWLDDHERAESRMTRQLSG